ncbi:hypothetical protein EI94DRAFT_1724709 [Lactarius quietus]|nr:hypothetical protein EI94DRAFT_1724709 [Lactarius quietus]
MFGHIGDVTRGMLLTTDPQALVRIIYLPVHPIWVAMPHHLAPSVVLSAPSVGDLCYFR